LSMRAIFLTYVVVILAGLLVLLLLALGQG
jgi:hypothetical protein